MLLFTVLLHLQSCIPPYSLRGERRGWRVCLKHVHHPANPCPANPPLQVRDQPIRTSPSTNISSACWLTHYCTSLVLSLLVFSHQQSFGCDRRALGCKKVLGRGCLQGQSSPPHCCQLLRPCLHCLRSWVVQCLPHHLVPWHHYSFSRTPQLPAMQVPDPLGGLLFSITFGDHSGSFLSGPPFSAALLGNIHV